MKVSFTLFASGGLNCPCKIFLAYMLGNALGRNNLLSSLALRTREVSSLFAPMQSDGMEIIMINFIKKYYCDKRFWKGALTIAIPIALQNILITSFGLIDTVMVGQLGDVSLAAVGMANQFTWLMNIILFGICSGTGMFVAQYWGVRDIKSINKVYGITMMCAVVLSSVFLLVGFFAPQFVIRIFNRDPVVVEQAVIYLRIVCFSYPAVVMSNVFSSLLRSTENVRLPMYVSMITTVLNAAANYVLIFGWGVFPAMGISGAALATCISAWTGVIITFGVSYKQHNILRAPIRELFAAKKDDVKEFFRRDLPVLINEGLWGLGTVTLNVIFSNLGYENYAAVTILRSFEDIAFSFFMGLGNACCVMVGKTVGRGEIKRAVDDAKRFTLIVPSVGVIVGALIIIFRHSLVGIFNFTDNITAATLSVAAGIMCVYACEIPMRNMPYIQIVGVFRSGGETEKGAKYDIICLWLMCIPATFLAAHVFKLPLVWVYIIMYLFEDYLKSFLCLKYFFSLKWINPVTKQGREGLRRYLEA